MSKSVVSLRLDDETLAALDKFVAVSGKTRTVVITTAVQMLLSDTEADHLFLARLRERLAARELRS